MEIQDGADLCFPELLNTSCKKPSTPQTGRVVIHIALYFICLITTALNLLVIISIVHFRQLHTPTNILLLSLAVSDFLVGLLLMPGEILGQTACWFLGDLMCSLYNFVSFIITSASVGDMVLISVDRYVAICHPLHYHTRITEKRVQICVCLCWMISVFYNLFCLRVELFQPGKYNSCYGVCVTVLDEITGTIDLVSTFIAPVIIIIVLYTRVFMVAVSHAHAMRSHPLQHSVTVNVRKSELKAGRSLGVLIVVFLICFCPYYCVSLADNNTLNNPFAFFVIYLFYFNSCLNPLIYALFYPWFRRSVKHIISLQILKPGSCDTNMV